MYTNEPPYSHRNKNPIPPTMLANPMTRTCTESCSAPPVNGEIVGVGLVVMVVFGVPVVVPLMDPLTDL